MTRPEFIASIRSLAVLFNRLGLLQQIYQTTPLTPTEEFKAYALSAMPKYSELFRIGLRNRDYNIVLNDYSYLQFAHSGDRGSLRVRCGFYRNPYVTLDIGDFQTLVVELGYEDVLQILDEQEEDSRAIVVRYDAALGDYVELRHPASHFHIGMHEESRWPIDKVQPSGVRFAHGEVVLSRSLVRRVG